MDNTSKIYVAGHGGMVGSAIVRNLMRQRYTNLILRTSKQLDLRRQADTEAFFQKEKPDYVFLAAATVGGIGMNIEKPAEMLYENAMIALNVLKSAAQVNVKKLLYLGATCIYPVGAQQPVKEGLLLKGEPEPTNQAYALGKITGVKFCEYLSREYGVCFLSVMPANAYGINDCFELEKSHVIPAMIARFHKAKEKNLPYVTFLGTGKPQREFLYVDDLASATVFLMQNYTGDLPVNIGTGQEISMRELAELVKKIVGYKGEIRFDTSKPDGAMRRVLDSSRLWEMGWRPQVSLESGLQTAYQWYLKNCLSDEIGEK